MICSQGKSLLLCHASMRGSHPLPDQLPGEHLPQVQIICTITLIAAIHTHTQHGNCIEVQWLGMFRWSTCVLLCAPMHIDMMAHTPAFLRVLSSGLPSCKQRIAGLFFFFFFFFFFDNNRNFFPKLFPVYLNPGPSTRQASALTWSMHQKWTLFNLIFSAVIGLGGF